MSRTAWLLFLVLGACDGGSVAPDAAAPPDAGPPPELPTCAGSVPGATGLAAALGEGEVRAGPIADASELLRGDSADGRVGDIKLYNARVAFVVQSVRTGDNWVPYGGALIDGDLVRPAEEWGEERIDELVTAFFVRPLSVRPFAAEEVCVIADGSDGGPAAVRAIGTDGDLPITAAFGATGTPQNLRIVQDFVLAPDADTLEIRTVVAAPAGARMGVGDFILMSDDGVDPFLIGAGFDRRRQGEQDSLAMVGSAGEDQHLVYAIFGDAPWTPDRVVAPILRDLGGDDMTIFFPLRDQRIEPNVIATFVRHVGIARDVDALNRARHAVQGVGALGEVSGRVTSAGAPVPGARVHALDLAVDPPAYASMARTGADGAFSIELLAGRYRLVATGRDIGQDVELPLRPAPDSGAPFAHGYATSAPIEVGVTGGGLASADLVLGAPATLRARLVDDATGAPIPGKVIVSFDGGSDPTPADAQIGERNPYASMDHVLWTSDGTVETTLEPGAYDVVGAYGTEWEIASRSVALAAGGTTEVELRLRRVIERDGWLVGDMHLHGGPSIHGEATREMRVVTVLAEGLDLFVASDHDRVIEYQPTIDALGLGDRVARITSDEISGVGTFHANPYPLVPQDDEPNGGATPWWDLLALRAVRLRARARRAAHPDQPRLGRERLLRQLRLRLADRRRLERVVLHRLRCDGDLQRAARGAAAAVLRGLAEQRPHRHPYRRVRLTPPDPRGGHGADLPPHRRRRHDVRRRGVRRGHARARHDREHWAVHRPRRAERLGRERGPGGHDRRGWRAAPALDARRRAVVDRGGARRTLRRRELPRRDGRVRAAPHLDDHRVGRRRVARAGGRVAHRRGRHVGLRASRRVARHGPGLPGPHTVRPHRRDPDRRALSRPHVSSPPARGTRCSRWPG